MFVQGAVFLRRTPQKIDLRAGEEAGRENVTLLMVLRDLCRRKNHPRRMIHCEA